MGWKGVSGMTDEELIREAKALYAHLTDDEEAFTMDDLHYFQELVEELEKRGYTMIESIDFVKKEPEEEKEEEEEWEDKEKEEEWSGEERKELEEWEEDYERDKYLNYG
jgi:lipid II:glycine glycyltransferase (peptidoglycan interpeptide bridge formation enzyme)